MDIERLLVSKVIEASDLGPAAEIGITKEWFADPATAQVWSMLIEHKAKYGNVPSIGAVRRDYPTYKLLASDEGLPYLVDEMRTHRHLVLQEAAVTDAAYMIERGNADRATQRLHQLLAELARSTANSSDIDLATNGDDRLAHYAELAKLDGGLRGIPSGFPAIDAALQGFEGGQLITFVGPPKTGKSWGLLRMAAAANNHGKEPLFIGFEMSNREQYERLDSLRARISFARLRSGTLTPEEKRKLTRAVKSQAELPSFHMTQDASSVMTLSGLQAKIEKIDPDIVFVDGVYMMVDEEGEPSGSPQALTNITRGLKRLAQQLQKPLVISTQALESKMNGKKLRTDSIGYSSSFLQDSDAVLGVEKTEDPLIIKIRSLASRNAGEVDVFYRRTWDPIHFEELEGDPFEGQKVDEDKAATYGW